MKTGGASMGLIRLEKHQRLDVSEIDTQHETLIELINQLHGAMLECSDRRVVEQLVTALVEHTQSHFHYEEGLMQAHRFPGYARHKQEHDRLLEHIEALAERCRAGDLLLSFAVMVDLKGWALVHIEKFDLALGHFLNRTGQAPGSEQISPRNGTR
jgi:hemerythrin-like metal-binding protein